MRFHLEFHSPLALWLFLRCYCRNGYTTFMN